MYPKFEKNEELREILVDSMISMAYSDDQINLIREWMEGDQFSLSPEQKYSILVKINSSN